VLLKARPPTTRLQTLLSLPARPSAPPSEVRDVVYDLNVDYTPSQLWNPTEGRPERVSLRSYQGTGVNPNAPFVGPLIEVYPGQTVRMTLHNKLRDDPTCPTDGGSVNIPHCFDTIVIRTRYERYIGDFVLHCHILDHEDQGMMENIRIAVPDGRGGVTHGHH
jgi:FtsP/CotA-like multicopper oxidase with cupredoxin domain